MVLMWAVLLVGPLRPVYADGLIPGPASGNVTEAKNAEFTNIQEVPASGPTSPPAKETGSWWQRLLKSLGNWFSDRWQGVQEWWDELPNWAKGLIVGLVAAVILVAIVIAVIAAGVVLSALAIVAIVGAVVGLVVAGLWYGLAEDGEFSIAKAIGWVLLGGVAGAAIFAFLWEVLPLAWGLLLKADAIVATTAGRIVSSLTAWVTSLLSPIGAYLAPRLAPVVAWFSGVAAWVQRAVQPVVNFVGPRWAALMERLAPITSAVSLRLQWFMQVTGIARMFTWVNTLFIRLGMWFEAFVATAPRLIFSTLNGTAMAVTQVAISGQFHLDEVVKAFLIGFGLTYITMLPMPVRGTVPAPLPPHATRPPLPGEVIQWPPNDGFHGTPFTQILKPGTLVDRYGRSGGSFLSPAGTPFEARALPPHYLNTHPYHVYEVVKPFEVQAGRIAPWFGQPGMGTQYLTSVSIQDLLDAGILREVLRP